MQVCTGTAGELAVSHKGCNLTNSCTLCQVLAIFNLQHRQLAKGQRCFQVPTAAPLIKGQPLVLQAETTGNTRMCSRVGCVCGTSGGMGMRQEPGASLSLSDHWKLQ